MRVLWFTNIPMPAMDARLGIATRGSGWWMSSLLDALRGQDGVRVGVATARVAAQDVEFSEGGVDYFVVAQTPASAKRRDDPADLAKCAAIVERWRPDVIHFHGTERLFGLIKARGLVRAPAVVSVQGLLGPYAKAVFGDLSWWELLRAHRLYEFVLGWGLLGQRRQFRQWAPREAEILRAADGALVRTIWDRAHVWRMAPGTPLFHVGETMRAPFYQREWSVGGCSRGQILVTTGPSALKGLQTLVRSMVLLRRERPDVTLHVAGAGLESRCGFSRFIRRLVRREGLGQAIRFLGWLDGEALMRRLIEANCFVLPSFIENSPNSLCEAMLLGLPCVASCVGGIASLIEDGRSGLLFPAGDETVLARRILDVLSDDGLAGSLGREARRAALARHDPARVVGELLSAYRAVLAKK